MLERRALGHGIGLRPPHYAAVLDGAPAVDWFEVITENFMVDGGNPRRVLRAVRERWPVVLHGVSLSIGSVDPLDEAYLDRLARLVREVEPAYVSDHLCWNRFGGQTGHDLWPVPFTEEALAHVAARVARVQERLGRHILVENVSRYVAFRHGRPAALTFYDRGGEPLSLFVFEPAGEDWPAAAQPQRGVGLVVWKERGLTYALAGALETDELRRLAGRP